MTPDQEPRTGVCTCTHGDDVCPYHEAIYPQEPGVRLWRFLADSRSVTYRTYNPETADTTPGIWFPLAEAEALLGKARDRDEWKASRELQKACADALRAEAEALIDPNDPAVRERLIALLHGDTGHAIADDLIAAPISEYADAVLAALRGAGATDAR